jgi:hypothetical protein
MVYTKADGVIANHYNQEYAYQVWGFVAPLLLLIGFVQYGSVALRMLFPCGGKIADAEADGRVVWRRASIRRLPLAIANAYRVLAFRTTFTIGPFSLNLAEVALTIAYIVVLFVWTFINSTHTGLPLPHKLTISGSHFSRRIEANAAILSGPCGEHRLWSTPARRRPRYQEQYRWV